MTKQQIIAMIVSGFIGAFAKLIIEKILGPYIPERKKLNSYIRKFFVFILLYAVPIGGIIFLIIVPTAVDKAFVFSMVFNFFVLLFNLTNSRYLVVMNKFDDHQLRQRGTLNNYYDAISETIKSTEAHGNQIKKIEEILRNNKQ